MQLTLYHNPRCGKSRAALALLEARGLKPQVVRYLETPPDAAALDHILQLLGKAPRDLMRRQEPPYKELGLDDPKLTRQALIAAMAANPILIERPILVRDGKRAALGRPPEAILDLL